MITEYGYSVVLTVGVIALIVILVSLFGIQQTIVKYSIIGVTLIVLLFTLYFFRDPERIVPDGENIVVSPADGKLVLIREIDRAEYIEAPATQMSIFLSPLNVHVNRIPWSGTVGLYRYIKGDYMVAYDHRASDKNERTEIGVERDGQRILFKQIVGSIARRIVCTIKEGDVVKKGERFGMIKFGSRMDVIVPRSATIQVQVGQKVVAGETILAVMPD